MASFNQYLIQIQNKDTYHYIK